MTLNVRRWCLKLWNTMHRRTATLALLLAFAISACAEGTPKNDDTATVTKITDGDTLEVTFPTGTTEVVRLIGIDAPEKEKCFYGEATAALAVISGAIVTLQSKADEDRDKYRRLLRYVEKDGEDVGGKLLRYGFVRAFPWFPHPKLEEYARIEVEARDERLGLWRKCRK